MALALLLRLLDDLMGGSMEAMLYEIRPWAFIIGGLYAAMNSANSGMLLYSGLLLAGTASSIVYARSRNRSTLKRTRF